MNRVTPEGGGDALTRVSCAAPSEAVDALFELLDAERFTPTAWQDVETGESRVDVFLETPSLADEVCAALRQAGDALGLRLAPACSLLARSDWSEGWKRFFHVEKVSRRVVVRPSWEPYAPKAGECVVTLDPGLSFGTGKHATTRACLAFLDTLADADPRRSVLDMGCGSGILAIAARLLGFSEVRGFDNDPTCIRVARENAAVNHVEIPFDEDDLAHAHQSADVVVANILAPVLIAFAPRIAASLTRGPSARLVLSGILDEQYAAVRDAYAAQGMREEGNRLLETWRSGLFRRV